MAWRQDLTRQLLGKEHGALGLVTWAKFPLSATEGDEVFSVALWTTNAREASFEAAMGKELLHRPHHDRAQWPVSGLEALFVSPNIAVEVVLKQLVQSA